MNREDIIRMAREAGFIINDENPMTHSLERFAALVAAAEREKVRSSMKKAFRRMAGLIRADEREACAKLADDQAQDEPYGHAKFRCANIAAAIRARGQA